MPVLIIVAGMPATGKSVLAGKLQKAFGFPILEKDAIKECLFDTLGFSCYEEKRRLDDAASAVLLMQTERLLSAGCSLILDNNFTAESGSALAALIDRSGVRAATLFLDGDTRILYERYVARDSAGARHPGHGCQDHYPLRPGEEYSFSMSREAFDWRFLRLRMNEPVWGGALLRLDAAEPEKIDTAAVICRLREELDL